MTRSIVKARAKRKRDARKLSNRRFGFAMIRQLRESIQ
jgi:hypothetical protein